MVVDILQTIHTVTQAISVVFSLTALYWYKYKQSEKKLQPRESSRFATPAIRTMKISAFYTKFNKNHEISSSFLLVADILQTTVQPSHKPLTIYFFLCFWSNNLRQKKQRKKTWVSGLFATPAIRTLKISAFYPKNHEKYETSTLLLLVVYILQSIHTVTQAISILSLSV